MEQNEQNTENKPSADDGTLVALGLILAALASTLELPPLLQGLMGLVAAGMLFWVIFRLARKT